MNDYGGFTFLETVISLVIVSVIGLSAAGLFASAASFEKKTNSQINSNNQLLLLDRYMRLHVSRIKIPYWVDIRQEPGFISDQQHLSIPFFEGEEDSILDIDLHNGILRIETPGEEKVFTGLRRSTISIFEDRRGFPLGVTLNLKKGGGRAFRISCAFGSAGYGVFSGWRNNNE